MAAKNGQERKLEENEGQFKAIERSFPQLSGRCLSRFHPTDPVLACGSTDSSSVILLKAANGSIPFSKWTIEREFQRQTHSRIRELEWNVNGTQLAAGCADGTAIVWSYPSGHVLFEEKKHSDEIDLIVWNPFRQEILATRRWPGEQLFYWNSRENRDAEKANHFLTLQSDGEIWSVAGISANQIAIGLGNGEIQIFEMDDDKGTSRVVKRFRHGKGINDLKWNERTKYLASCSQDDKWIKIWSMDSDQPVHILQIHSYCYCFAWRRNVKTDNDGGIGVARKDKENFKIACGLVDGSILIWNPLEEDETKRTRIIPQKHSNRVSSLSFSPDERFLASADSLNELIIWSVKTWLPVFTCQNAGRKLSWISTNSSSVPHYKLTVESYHKVIVFEEPFTG